MKLRVKVDREEGTDILMDEENELITLFLSPQSASDLSLVIADEVLEYIIRKTDTIIEQEGESNKPQLTIIDGGKTDDDITSI